MKNGKPPFNGDRKKSPFEIRRENAAKQRRCRVRHKAREHLELVQEINYQLELQRPKTIPEMVWESFKEQCRNPPSHYIIIFSDSPAIYRLTEEEWKDWNAGRLTVERWKTAYRGRLSAEDWEDVKAQRARVICD